MRRGRGMAVALGLAVVLAATAPARACPNCKEAVVAQPSDAEGIASGYNWSVLFMLVMPFTMLSTGAFAVVRASRRGLLPEM